MMTELEETTGALRRAKLQSNRHHNKPTLNLYTVVEVRGTRGSPPAPI